MPKLAHLSRTALAGRILDSAARLEIADQIGWPEPIEHDYWRWLLTLREVARHAGPGHAKLVAALHRELAELESLSGKELDRAVERRWVLERVRRDNDDPPIALALSAGLLSVIFLPAALVVGAPAFLLSKRRQARRAEAAQQLARAWCALDV